MSLLFLLSFIPFFIYMYFVSLKSIHMLQLNFYDENHRYFKWLLKNPTKVFLTVDMFFVIFAVFITTASADEDNGYVFNYVYPDMGGINFDGSMAEVDKRTIYSMYGTIRTLLSCCVIPKLPCDKKRTS